MGLFPKSSFGRKYTRLIAGSPIIFVLVLLSGILLFLTLTLSIKVESIKTYPAELISARKNGSYVLSVKSPIVSAEKAYLYTNKNESVHPVTIQKVESAHAHSVVHVSESEKEMLQPLPSEPLYLDVPQGKRTLFYWIIVKGGKGNG